MISIDDKKAILIIKDRIEKFEKSPLTLDSLLSITYLIEQQINELKETPKKWVELFRTQWWELELISSVMMDSETDTVSNQGKVKINETISNMKSLINEWNM